MRVFSLCVVVGSIVVSASTSALGCDASSGERRQLAFLEWNHRPVENWQITSSEVRKFELPNGFLLGLKIQPAPMDAYAKAWQRGRHSPELVRISVFDMSGETPREITSTLGGTNSVQGFGANGGADRVEQLGDPGITLTLLKPVCARPEVGPVVTAAGG